MTDDKPAKDVERYPGFWFEQIQNGEKCWSERELMGFLEYSDRRAFRNVVKKAMRAWLTLGNETGRDYKLLDDDTYKFSRSACFMIVFNAASKKVRVAQTQVYLAGLASDVLRSFDSAAMIERVVHREDLTEGQKVLAATAKALGVTSFAMFQDAGYRGMYNMTLEELTSHKGVPSGEKLRDWMDRAELAANVFRVTQTEEKIRNEQLHGQDQLEAAHKEVGDVVREAMIKTSGRKPEDLLIARENIKETRKRLKGGARALEKFDEKPALARKLHTLPDQNPDDELDGGFTRDPEEDSPPPPSVDPDDVPF